MPIEVILGAVAVALALPVLWLSVSAARAGSGGGLFRKHVNPLADVTDMRELVLQRGAGERVVRPFIGSLAAAFRSITPAGWVERLDRRVALAGLSDRWPVERLLVAKFVLFGGTLLLGMLSPMRGLPLGPLLIVGFAVIGFFVPDSLVAHKADARQLTIRLELPDGLDQITMSVDAGLGFEAAMSRVSQAGDGPLAEEMRRALYEMQLGSTRTEALRNLAERNDVDDLRSFVFAVVQSEQYGLPIAHVLRVQAAELRDKRRQRAEERALKIPVLLIMPLAFGIFPAMFIVLLGPAAIRIFRDLSVIAP